MDYEDGQYALTMQLLMPNAIEETVSSDSVWIVSGQGDSVGDALETLAMRAPREIYLAHLDIILLGEGLLQEDVEDGFAFMLKRTALRRRTNLLAVEGKAGDVLQAKAELSDVDIYYLTNLIRDQNRQVNNSEAILNDYYLTVENGLAEGLVIPRVEVENEQSIRLQGAALVADKKLLGWVDQSWLSSYRWITGGKELMTLHDVGSTQSDVTIELSKKKCKWELIAEDPLQVRAKLQAQMVIVENDLQTEQLSLEANQDAAARGTGSGGSPNPAADGGLYGPNAANRLRHPAAGTLAAGLASCLGDRRKLAAAFFHDKN